MGSAVFKAVEALFTQRLVGSIPIHSRSALRAEIRCFSLVSGAYVIRLTPLEDSPELRTVAQPDARSRGAFGVDRLAVTSSVPVVLAAARFEPANQADVWQCPSTEGPSWWGVEARSRVRKRPWRSLDGRTGHRSDACPPPETPYGRIQPGLNKSSDLSSAEDRRCRRQGK